jgi:hypothetical protein
MRHLLPLLFSKDTKSKVGTIVVETCQMIGISDKPFTYQGSSHDWYEAARDHLKEALGALQALEVIDSSSRSSKRFTPGIDS